MDLDEKHWKNWNMKPFVFCPEGLNYNWIGHKHREEGVDEVCIYTINLSGHLDYDLNYISSDSLSYLVEKRCLRKKVPYDVGLKTNVIGSSIYLSEIFMSLKSHIRERKVEGYIDVFSPDYDGGITINQLKNRLHNSELEIIENNFYVYELECLDNRKIENKFDVGISYLLVNPLRRRIFLDLSVMPLTIEMYDKYGEKQIVETERFDFVYTE